MPPHVFAARASLCPPRRSRLRTVATRLLLLAMIVTPLLSARPHAAVAATVPAGFSEGVYVSGVSNATAMAFAPDGRLFVAEQGGDLRVVKNGTLLGTAFLSVSVDDAGERGLLGVAFDPQFTSNGSVYVYYTVRSTPTHNRVSRFTAVRNGDGSWGDTAVAGSETLILRLDDLSGATNHNGGAMHFGADGKLYIATGENANAANAQTLSNLLGKLLRINADGSIPSDNPFYNQASGKNRAIWALGLRNPFSFNVQPGTGRLFINDVGAGYAEEINDGIGGANYGWPATEGYTSDSRYRSPLYSYFHGGAEPTGCAITGGAFYNPPTPRFPAAYAGDYFFADYCSGWVWRYDVASDSVSEFADGFAEPVDLQVGPDGALYVATRGDNAVHRISYSAASAPSITGQPQSQTVAAGQSATFTVTATGTAPLQYQWQRNGTNIAGATAAGYTTPATTAAENGASFRVVVSNAQGSVTSSAATLSVSSNRPPSATIATPAAGTLYTAGQPVSYSGSATDPEEGTLPASAYTWEIIFHHDTHTHPFAPPASGSTSGSFTPATTGHTESTVWYRIQLTVRDSSGVTATAVRDVRPRTAQLTLASSPSGLGLTLDGQPLTTPATVTGVAGVQRTLGAPATQTLGGTSYAFVSWSDGGAATHTLTTPSTDTTYTATYRPSSLSRAQMTNPVPNSTLPGSSTTFSWSAGSGGEQYALWVGTGSAGSYDIHANYHSTSATVSGLPTNGIPVYVRLWTKLAGAWEFTDYTYTAATVMVTTTKAALTSPTPGSTLSGSSVTLNWSAGSGAEGYALWVGSTGTGSYNLYAGYPSGTSAVVTGLPTSGGAVYVRLWTKLAGAWQFTDYTYTAASVALTKASMTSPAVGSTLSGSSASFSWTAGSGAEQYALWVGTSVGAYNIHANYHSSTSAVVTGLPTNGGTVYVRLWTKLAGAWQSTDYTYTAASTAPARASLTSPTPGSILPGASVTLSWTAVAGAEQYALWVGSTGTGSYNLYADYPAGTSATITGLPTNGETVSVRLWTKLAGAWQYHDYTYTAVRQ